MPPAVGVLRGLGCGRSVAYWSILAHTPHQTAIAMGVWGSAGNRGMMAAPTRSTPALQCTFSTKHPIDGERRAQQTLNPQIDDKLGVSEPYSPAPGKEQSPMDLLGAAGASSKSLLVYGEGNKKPEDWNDILNRWYKHYQDFIGITDLKKAQDRVTELSEGLLEAQGERRRLQAEIEGLQGQLVDNHQRITKTEQYSQEHMRLFSEARDLSDRLRQVRGEFAEYERKERETFTQLSSAIRDCHERERMQAEQSKYWSIIASVVSAALASVITSVNNWVRIREVKDHISASHHTLLEGYQQMRTDILAILDHTPASTPTGLKDAKDLSQEMRSLSEQVAERISTATDSLVASIQAILVATTGEKTAPALAPALAPATSTGAAGAEVSYPRVAATMLVGAALGTLVTAFFLGALGGSGGG